MKKIVIYILTAVAALSLASCDRIFDSLEGDLTKMEADQFAASTAGLDRLMANLYASLPMGAFAEADKNTPNANDSASSGSYNGGVSGMWDYVAVRDVNMFFQTLEIAKANSVVSEAEYKAYLGEAHFIRAYYYFGAVRYYGGVPIVTEPLDGKFDPNSENPELYIPRSKEKECWDFVLSELDLAIENLPVF